MSGYELHPTSVVDDGAQIGGGTKIWHFCHIERGAVIGEQCSVGQNCYVASGAVLGHRVRLQNNVSVYAGVQLGEGVFCGPSAVFTNDLTPRALHPKKRTQWLSTPVGTGATIGANATILCGNRVGCWAMVAAGAVVTQDVPDYALVMGVPARQTGWVCRCGAVLPDSLQCAACGAEYRLEGGMLHA